MFPIPSFFSGISTPFPGPGSWEGTSLGTWWDRDPGVEGSVRRKRGCREKAAAASAPLSRPEALFHQIQQQEVGCRYVMALKCALVAQQLGSIFGGRETRCVCVSGSTWPCNKPQCLGAMMVPAPAAAVSFFFFFKWKKSKSNFGFCFTACHQLLLLILLLQNHILEAVASLLS